jgi:hypothetical protein
MLMVDVATSAPMRLAKRLAGAGITLIVPQTWPEKPGRLLSTAPTDQARRKEKESLS